MVWLGPLAPKGMESRRGLAGTPRAKGAGVEAWFGWDPLRQRGWSRIAKHISISRCCAMLIYKLSMAGQPRVNVVLVSVQHTRLLSLKHTRARGLKDTLAPLTSSTHAYSH